MAIGYIDTLSDANDYFTDERLDSTCWDDYAESGDARQNAVLIQAYNRLYYSKTWSLPESIAGLDAADTKRLQIAQLETAYYMCCHLQDEDRRKGLQTQAVTDAGVVKEKYDKDRLDKLPFPAIVHTLLDKWKKETGFHILELTRDETYKK
jgi:hypothetical protein